VSAILRKLAVPNREAAADVATGLGLAGPPLEDGETTVPR
jgi:hypothetical protein